MSSEQTGQQPDDDGDPYEGFVGETTGTGAAIKAVAKPEEDIPSKDEEKSDSKGDGKSEDDDPASEVERVKRGFAKSLARKVRQREEARDAVRRLEDQIRARDSYIEHIQSKSETSRTDEYGLNPGNFSSVNDYADARLTLMEKMGEVPEGFKLALKECSQIIAQEEVSADDAEWLENAKAISPYMVIALSHADDPSDFVADLRKLSDEERADLFEMTPRTLKRAMKKILKDDGRDKPKAKAAPAEEEKSAPPRDPGTGRFRKQSDAPPPFEEVRGAAQHSRALSELSFAEFEKRRNEEERDRSGW